MKIDGLAHIQITAGRYEISRSFYGKLLPFLGLELMRDNASGAMWLGGRTGVVLSPPAPEYEGERFLQQRIGLHHVCFAARSRRDVNAAHAFVQSLGAPIIRAPWKDSVAPGYYSILFEDPDGVRLEVNHQPKRSWLDPKPTRSRSAAPREA
jgi:catechol 2,3-dioxygenase-like lactoylglutathione lyase family enzyme